MGPFISASVPQTKNNNLKSYIETSIKVSVDHGNLIIQLSIKINITYIFFINNYGHIYIMLQIILIIINV